MCICLLVMFFQFQVSFFSFFISFCNLNCLVMPGSTVAVERIFSGGHDTISLCRAGLRPSTIRTLMILKHHLQLKRKLNDDVPGPRPQLKFGLFFTLIFLSLFPISLAQESSPYNYCILAATISQYAYPFSRALVET